MKVACSSEKLAPICQITQHYISNVILKLISPEVHLSTLAVQQHIRFTADEFEELHTYWQIV
jgi:hypothetical protein